MMARLYPQEIALLLLLAPSKGVNLTVDEAVEMENPYEEWPDWLKEKVRKVSPDLINRLEAEKEEEEAPVLRVPVYSSKDEARKALSHIMEGLLEEDLARLKREFRSDMEDVLITMVTNPKEKWKELGISDYMMKYELG